jgi:YidC/Oxa1 family membrane protein insertase
VWDTFIIQPILNVLLLLYKFFGHETIIAVTLVTLIFRLILTPLQLNQQKSTKKQREMQPKLKELQVKYKDNREQLAQEQMKLYREAGINPTGGCLTLLIQLPIMLGLYQAIIRALASTPLQLLALPKDIYTWLPGIVALIPLKSRFLWLDLALPDPFYILPVLVVVSAWFYQKLITPPPADAQAAAMNKQMMIMMPLMTGFFAATYASGLAVYFLISNLVGILQYYLFKRHYEIAEPDKALSSPSKPIRKVKA